MPIKLDFEQRHELKKILSLACNEAALSESVSILIDARDKFDVGKYAITHDRDSGDYWIGLESGEGMQVFKHNFEKLIDDYYKSEF